MIYIAICENHALLICGVDRDDFFPMLKAKTSVQAVPLHVPHSKVRRWTMTLPVTCAIYHPVTTITLFVHTHGCTLYPSCSNKKKMRKSCKCTSRQTYSPMTVTNHSFPWLYSVVTLTPYNKSHNASYLTSWPRYIVRCSVLVWWHLNLHLLRD